MIRNVGTVIKDIIRQQGLSVTDAANLYGDPLVLPANINQPISNGTWLMHYLDTSQVYSPDDIISKLASVQLQAAPIVTAVAGVLSANCPTGTTMFSTTIDVPNALSIPIDVECPGK